jgi:C1A family cysteine protease
MIKNMRGSFFVGIFLGLLLLTSMGSTIGTFSDENFETFQDEGCGCIFGTITEDETVQSEEPYTEIRDDLPAEWDWRDVDGQDWTTPIKDQLQDVCGSCWAFGALGGLEAMIKIWENDSSLDVDLSEQYMLSCSPGDCNGWYWTSTLLWIKGNGAIPEACFPYQAEDTIPCEDKCPEWGSLLVGVENYKKVSSNVSVIQSALVEHGPLPASMDVYEDFYPNYAGGVYQYTWGGYVFGHCVTIVGYNNSWGGPDEGYWIVKNSWGTNWGEDGWFRIAYGECNMEKGVYYYTGPNYANAKPDAPTGPTNGAPWNEYTYTALAADPDGDAIRYCIDWGEGNSSWSETVSSGTTVSMNYTWREKGEYLIRVKVRDEHGLDSPWSDPLPVSMPMNMFMFTKIFSFGIFERFFQFVVMRSPLRLLK